jgi:hypothetical protein
MSRVSFEPTREEEHPISDSPGTPSPRSVDPTSMGNVPPPPPLNIGGMLVRPLAVRNFDSHFSLNVHSMSARARLSEDERVKIFTKAAAPFPNDAKFQPLPIAITDPHHLTEFQDFDIMITLAKERMEQFDLAGVFNIVFPDPTGTLKMDNPGTVSVVNLFSEYSKVEVCDVAASNRWFHENFEDTSEIHTNLQWSYAFLANNMEKALSNRVRRQHDAFPEPERGGPLLFILLLQDLLHVAESAADDLHAQLKRLRIDAIPGENVKTVSAVISSVARRIWFTSGGEFPKEFVDSVLKVFQTSSVRAFNVQFDKIAAERDTEAILDRVHRLRGQPVPPHVWKDDLNTIHLITDSADQYFDRFSRSGEWTKNGKNKPSPVPQVMVTTVTCFNCGKAHHWLSCPDPIDESRVNENKAEFLQKKEASRFNPRKQRLNEKSDSKFSKTSRRPFKFRPPDRPSETKRVIHTDNLGEHLHLWDDSTKRWIPETISTDGTLASHGNALNTVGPSTNISTNINPSALRAQMAEIQRVFQQWNNQM